MARLTYDFPLGYDRLTEYDADQSPSVPNYDLDMDAVDAGSMLVTPEMDAALAVLGEAEATLEAAGDGDMASRLAHDSDLGLRMEAKS